MFTDQYPTLMDIILFDGMERDEIDKLLIDYSVELLTFVKSDTIYSPVEKERKLGIILSGKAAVYSTDAKKKVLLRSLEKAQIFGISNLFSKSDKFSTYIVARTPCVVLFLSADNVSDMMQKNKKFLHNYIEYLANRVRFLNKKINYFTAGSAERRLSLFLCSLGDGDVVNIKCSMSDLSLMLDIGRASLYRAFDTLIEDKCINRLTTKKVEILNRSQMLKIYK